MLKRFALTTMLSGGILAFSAPQPAAAADGCRVEVGVECDASGCRTYAKLVCDVF